jgi:tRNA U34 5-carboxymethylaminomethyl modifying GTPase MnmE/TrmE
VILSLYDGEDVPEAIGANEIQVRTKCDLSLPARKCGIAISAKTGEGLAQLKQALGQRLSKLVDNCERTLSAAPDELVAALSLVPSHEDFKDGADLVLIGNKLRFLADKLGELVGATYSEDLLENLFSRFCVGK